MSDFPVLSWNAHWVAFGSTPQEDPGVYVLRCPLKLDEVPSELKLRISADQRYKLFVNGAQVAFGPQRGDLDHWFFDTVDIAPYLKPGENVVSALFWFFGWLAPMAQITMRAGFLCDADVEALQTPGEWQIARVPGWEFGCFSKKGLDFVGPDEKVDGTLTPDWTKLPYRDDLDWITPLKIRSATSKGDTFEPWWALIPRSIPPMRYEVREARPAIRADWSGTPNPRGEIGDQRSEIRDQEPQTPNPRPQTLPPTPYPLPANGLLLDYGELLCAYPRLVLEGEPGTEVRISYAEGLWLPDEWGKGNRNEVAGKQMKDMADIVVLGDGPTHFEPLWWRTYRYLLVEVNNEGNEAADSSSLVPRPSLLQIDAIETGYPYEVESSFEADDSWVKPLWDVSLRTAFRCAGETYFDCPFYEQLQYVGDTRIQAMIHYYLSTDRALARNAVEQFGWSIMENGLTQSRYPNRTTQMIPPFSLWWVLMLQDQMLYDRLPAEKRPSIRAREHPASVVAAFDRLRGVEAAKNGSWWNFGDWVPTWRHGEPPGRSRSAVHRLTYKLAEMAALKPVFEGKSGANMVDEAAVERAHAAAWRNFSSEFDHKGGLVHGKKYPKGGPSEHAEALYRIGQAACGLPVDPWPTDALEATDAVKCTYYFSYYKHWAKAAAALGAESHPSAPSDSNPQPPFDYLTELAPWKEMIENGLTTYAENPEPVRSDCHAWSAHPALGFFQFVAGVTSIAPGWTKARVAPQPGSLRRFDARIAHPDGELRVLFEDGKLEIDTPVPAQVVWKGKTEEFEAGKHRI